MSGEEGKQTGSKSKGGLSLSSDAGSKPATSNTLRIQLDLDEKLSKKFLAIKKEKGIERNTNVARNLIAEAYNDLKRKGA